MAGHTNLGGSITGDLKLAKLDQQCNVAWTKTYGGADVELAYEIKELSDGSPSDIIGSQRMTWMAILIGIK